MWNWFDKHSNKLVAGSFVVLFVTLFAVLLSPAPARAADRLFYKTPVGYVVLTDEPCEYTFGEPTPFELRAYATEAGKNNHEGCFFLDMSGAEVKDGIITFDVYWPELDQTALYDARKFTQKKESF